MKLERKDSTQGHVDQWVEVAGKQVLLRQEDLIKINSVLSELTVLRSAISDAWRPVSTSTFGSTVYQHRNNMNRFYVTLSYIARGDSERNAIKQLAVLNMGHLEPTNVNNGGQHECDPKTCAGYSRVA